VTYCLFGKSKQTLFHPNLGVRGARRIEMTVLGADDPSQEPAGCPGGRSPRIPRCHWGSISSARLSLCARWNSTLQRNQAFESWIGMARGLPVSPTARPSATQAIMQRRSCWNEAYDSSRIPQEKNKSSSCEFLWRRWWRFDSIRPLDAWPGSQVSRIEPEPERQRMPVKPQQRR
jgi:hypothetical protein